MQSHSIPIWKTAPFCRLLLPLLAGIILQWYLQFSCWFMLVCEACFFIGFLFIYLLDIGTRFKLQWLQGILLHLVVMVSAMLITWQKDARHDQKWYGHFYNDSVALIIRIDEPLVTKERSFKADAWVEAVICNGQTILTKGKLLAYFSKDSVFPLLHYGDRLLISSKLQAIKNSGNPGAFNYERYAAFQQIFHNVYLKAGDWRLLPGKKINPLKAAIFSMQHYVISVLKKYINRSRDELGISEALLIGYKEDLDKDLVQAYSNAGVVHIIAISGLHLGLIYVMLAWILDRLPLIRKNKFLKLLLLLSCLWIFSLLTGASGSVLRSAVMFSFIVVGKNYFKQASIYNSLAGSAFLLLCYDPYLLWDVGFQLSYLALLGIVTLQQPINRLMYIPQKWLYKIWELFSVTLAAQIAAFPLCIYYFHQFPNLFFITNILAVPLSTVILFAEILLIAVSGLHLIAVPIGHLVAAMVWLMNRIITTINSFSFAVWDNIYANIFTTWFLYAIILFGSAWLLYRYKNTFLAAMLCLLAFTGLHVYAKIMLKQQVKLIVYNVPKCQAIDLIYKDQYCFIGDSILQRDGMLQNFHLKPARISLQLDQYKTNLPNLYQAKNYYRFFGKKILLADSTISYQPLAAKISIDVLIISKNPSLKISGITNAIKPSIIVFDSSNSLWKIAKWKKECLALALPCFSIPAKGAFVLDID